MRGGRCDSDLTASRIVGKYYMGSRRHFRDHMHMKMAVDAARIGDIDALCGVCLAGPADDLRAAWMAPQAGHRVLE